jgi:hypothetical protein
MNKWFIISAIAFVLLVGGLLVLGPFLFTGDPDALTSKQQRMVHLLARGDSAKEAELSESYRSLNNMRRRLKDGSFLQGRQEGQNWEEYQAQREEDKAHERKEARKGLEKHIKFLKATGNRRIERSLAMQELVKAENRKSALLLGSIAIDDPVYRLEYEGREMVRRLPASLRHAILGLRSTSFWTSEDGEALLYYLFQANDPIPKDMAATFKGTTFFHSMADLELIYDGFFGVGSFARQQRLAVVRVEYEALTPAANLEHERLKAIRESDDPTLLRTTAQETTTSFVYRAAMSRLSDVDQVAYKRTCLARIPHEIEDGGGSPRS